MVMGKGAVSGATYVTRSVPLSGLSVRRLVHGTGDCHHLYFTNSGWYDGGRRLVFGRCLTADEKREFAVTLREALVRARSAVGF